MMTQHLCEYCVCCVAADGAGICLHFSPPPSLSSRPTASHTLNYNILGFYKSFDTKNELPFKIQPICFGRIFNFKLILFSKFEVGVG